MGSDHLIMYPKKLGILISEDSAIAFTIKFGALPIYVNAPKNTDALDIASKVCGKVFIKEYASPPAVLKNTKYVGALSKKPDNTPVNQKYINTL